MERDYFHLTKNKKKKNKPKKKDPKRTFWCTIPPEKYDLIFQVDE